MTSGVKRYTGEAVDVTFDTTRCIHAAECVNGLPAVFDTGQRPWIQPANASADETVGVVLRCPSGALHFERKDGGMAESTPERNTIDVRANGPLYVRGDVTIATADGEIRLADTRMALCRCGQSGNKPFCDNSHLAAGFADAGDVKSKESSSAAVGGMLTITPNHNGPLQVEGNVTILSSDGESVFQASKTWLCRCGGSANKPFCNGTHKRIGFQAD